MTKRLPRRLSAALLLGELVEQRVALLRAETANATARRDVELLHQLPCPDLPHAGQGFQNGRHLHLADGVVAVPAENVLQRQLPRLQLTLELGALAASLGRLL